MSQLSPYFEMLDESNLKDLSRRSDLGELSFEPILPSLRIVRKLLQEAIPQEEELPPSKINEAQSSLEALTRLIEQVRNFSLTESNPSSAHHSIVSQIDSTRDSIQQALQPYVRDLNIEALRREILEQLDAIQDATAKAQQATSSAEHAAQDTRQAQVATAGRAAHDYFDSNAGTHKRTARNFLISTIALVVLLAVVAVGEFIFQIVSPPDYDNTGDALVTILPRLTLIVIVSFAIGFCARNYRVNMHLEVLNRTKAITIQAADQYAAGVENPNQRDFIVNTLVQSVLTLGDTGYLPVDSEKTIVESPGAYAFLSKQIGTPSP